MIQTLYDIFKPWSEGGSIWILSDTHFDDKDCKFMDENWLTPEEHIAIINKRVYASDTLIHLGDVGSAKYLNDIRARRKILICGNHDKPHEYKEYFSEIFTGPVQIAEKIILSHEPIQGLDWCLNIHGHDHAGVMFPDDNHHINLASNVANYTPVNLKHIINAGYLSNIPSIHRITIDNATARKYSK